MRYGGFIRMSLDPTGKEVPAWPTTVQRGLQMRYSEREVGMNERDYSNAHLIVRRGDRGCYSSRRELSHDQKDVSRSVKMCRNDGDI
jgi:hypothetical protein